MDIMYIDRKPILHIVDEGTHFSAARFLPYPETNTVGETILQAWATIYTGLTNKTLVDEGSNFGKTFVRIAEVTNDAAEPTGIEAHSSLGLGERYHQPLRNTLRKLRREYPKASKELLFSLSVKAMNDTLGPEGLVPTVLVFGEHPHPITAKEIPPPRIVNASRARIAVVARIEMEKHMANVRV